MFGRSGQMFPRRAYHDAIYEEEYGSESDEDCCRGRGLSAILCWFLSVIILIGLAASVVLTVFFILKSRSLLTSPISDQDDLNFVFDHGNGFKIAPTTVSTTVDLSLNASSTRSPPEDNEGGNSWMRTKSYIEATARATTTSSSESRSSTTKFPPVTTTRYTTRKYYSDTTGDYSHRTTPIPPTSEASNVFKFLFNTIKTFSGDEDEDRRYNSESIEQPPIDEITDNTSDEDFVPHPAPHPTSSTPTQHFHSSSSEERTTTPAPVITSSPVLFTLPPLSSTVSHTDTSGGSSRRYTYPTRSPERTSFSSEETSASTYKHYDYRKPYVSPPRRTSSEETTTAETTSYPSVESSISNESYQPDESKKLSSMLQDQIPPHHHDNHNNHHHNHREDQDSREYTATPIPSSSSTKSDDRLAQIIRNLQPKWNKTTVGTTPRTRNRYIEIRTNKNSKESHSSGEKYKTRPLTTFPPTTVYIVTPEKPATTSRPTTMSRESAEFSSPSTNSGRKVLASPENSREDSQEDNSSKEFMDILVGNDNEKTLVTKQTESGNIITSAILPPWFNPSPNSTDSLELTNDTLRFTTEKITGPSEHHKDIVNEKTKSDLDALFDLFSTPSKNENEEEKNPVKRKDAKPKSETYVSDIKTDESKASHLKNLEEELKPFFSSPSEPEETRQSPVRHAHELQSPPATGFEFGPSDGKSHIYGYYPEDEDLGDDDRPTIDHVDIEIEEPQENKVVQTNINNQNRRNGSEETDEDVSDGQSPVIDIAYDPKIDPEIIIEPEAGELLDDEYTDNISEMLDEPMAAAGTDVHSGQVYVPPPENMISSLKKTNSKNDGGGIRRPTKNERKSQGQQIDQTAAEQVLVPTKVEFTKKEPTEPPIRAKDWSSREMSLKWTSQEMTAPSKSVELDELIPNREGDEEFSDESLQEDEEGIRIDDNYSEPSGRNGTRAESDVEENHNQFNANRQVERKPIVDVDSSLYDIKEDKVRSMTTTSTTQKPRVRVYEVYSEPYHPSAPPEEPSTERPSGLTSEELSNQTGFVPPKPISFHETSYVGEKASGEYVSRDGWRPVLYGPNKDEKASGEIVRKNRLPHPQQPPMQSPPQQPFSSPSRRAPTFTAPNSVPITTPLHMPPTTPSNNGPTATQYEDEMVSQENNWYPDNPNRAAEQQQQQQPKIKPSRPIPPMMMPHAKPPRVRFPESQPPLRPPPQQQSYPTNLNQLPSQQAPSYSQVIPNQLLPNHNQQPPLPHKLQQSPQSPTHAHVHHQGVQQQQQQQSQMIQKHQQNQIIQQQNQIIQQQNQMNEQQLQNQMIQQQQQMNEQQLQNQMIQQQQQNQMIQQQNQMIQQQQQGPVQSTGLDRPKFGKRPGRPPIVVRRKPPFPFSSGGRKRITKIKIPGPPRNPPRGPPYSPLPPGSPEQYHSQQQQQQQQQQQMDMKPNAMIQPTQATIRQRYDPPYQQQPQSQGPVRVPEASMMHGNVLWPPDDMYVRRQQPHMMNRRPGG